MKKKITWNQRGVLMAILKHGGTARFSELPRYPVIQRTINTLKARNLIIEYWDTQGSVFILTNEGQEIMR